MNENEFAIRNRMPLNGWDKAVCWLIFLAFIGAMVVGYFESRNVDSPTDIDYEPICYETGRGIDCY